MARDLFIPQVRDVEVWFGFELTGWSARISAPLHWAVFGFGAWGFWAQRSWIWPIAAMYAFYIAASHLVWNVTSSRGGGLEAGLWQFGLFLLPAVMLIWVRPRNPASSSFNSVSESSSN